MVSHNQMSRYMAKVLRHEAAKEGIALTADGYAYVDDILAKKPPCTLRDVEIIVARDSKSRFTLRNCPYTGKWQIRANQGHSQQGINVDMEEITKPSQAPVLLHGTYQKNWELIKIQGLSRMKRTHIHFAPGENSPEVISGIPRGCTIIISVDTAKAMKAGITFHRSANNVLLSPGNERGLIPVSCFKKVYDRRTRENLYP